MPFLEHLEKKNFFNVEKNTKSLNPQVKSLSRVRLCDPMNYSLPGSSIHGIFPGKNTGVGCHFLLQGIVPTQGLNPGLLHCRLYRLSHQGSPKVEF